MRKWIAGAAMMLAPLAAKGQGAPANAQIELTNLVIGTDRITGTVLVRNTSPFDPTRIYSLEAVNIRVNSPVQSQLGGSGSWSVVGRVNTARIGDINGGTPLFFGGDVFGIEGPGVISNLVQFGVLRRAVPNYGLLGCSLPINRFPSDVTLYAGQTCAEAGFDGAVQLNFRFDYQGTPAPQLTAADFSISADGRFVNGPAYFVTPEPSTYVLMAAGLAALGFVARRRRA